MIAVSGVQLIFRVPDPGRRLAGVRLRQEARIPGDLLDFRRGGDWWELVVPRPPVSRMEYLLELRQDDGSGELVTDPENPMQVAGAFGMKSVLEFPCYRPPEWLTAPAEPGTSRTFDLAAPSLGAEISVRTWSPAGTADDEPLPLLSPGPRDSWYSANVGYARALRRSAFDPHLTRLLGQG